MNYRQLGKTGIQVSELSLGSWITFGNQLDVESAAECMSAAREAGVNFFDTAETYARGAAEEVMGAALRKLGWRRGSFLVSTKFYWGLHKHVNERNTLNRKRLIEGIRGSLERLQLDYVDLIFCHRPDPTTPIEETVWAMHNIIDWGKALYWGTSEWAASEIVSAIEIAERHHLHKPVVEQPIYNLLERHRFGAEYRHVYRAYGLGSTTWSPLATGVLTGKYANGIPTSSRAALKGHEWLKDEVTDPVRLQRAQQLYPIAGELGCTLAQLAIAWCLKNPRVSTVITGASRVEQVRENMLAVEVVPKLTAAVLQRVDQIMGVSAEPDDE